MNEHVLSLLVGAVIGWAITIPIIFLTALLCMWLDEKFGLNYHLTMLIFHLIYIALCILALFYLANRLG